MPPEADVRLDSTAQSRLFTPYVLLVLAAQTAFGFGWSLYLLQPKFLATQLGASADAIGRITAMGGFTAIATIPLVASVIDRFGRKPLFWLGALLLVGLSLGYLAVDRIDWRVYLLYGCTGAAFVTSFNATATLVSEAAPPARLGQAIGVLGAANMSMNAVATVIAEHIAEVSGWDGVFWLGVGAGALALLLSLGIREPAREPRRATDTGAGMHGLHPLLRPLLVTVLIGGAFSAMFTFSQPFALSLGLRDVSSFFVGFTCASVVMRVGLGSLGDRFGRQRVSLAALVAYAATALSMAWLVPGALWAYGAAFGTAHGVLYPTLNALLLEHAPTAYRGRVITWYNGAFNVGTAFSNLAWGGIAAAAGYPPVFVAAAAVACVGAGALMRPVMPAVVATARAE